MEKKELLYEGKAKKVYTTEDPDVLIVSYKDDATAFNGEKKGTIAGKGVINNRMSNHVFKLVEKAGVPTHLIEELNDRETAVKKVEIVPLEVIVRRRNSCHRSDPGVQLSERRSGRSADQRIFCHRAEPGHQRRDREDYQVRVQSQRRVQGVFCAAWH